MATGEADAVRATVGRGELAQPAAPRRLSWPVRLAWMVCAMPELLKSFAWDAFVLFFYAQVVGLNGALIGAAVAVIILFDTLVDPWIGALSDRLSGARFGRRHSLMFAAVLPYTIGIAAVFAPPPGMGQGAIFAWLLGFGLLAAARGLAAEPDLLGHGAARLRVALGDHGIVGL